MKLAAVGCAGLAVILGIVATAVPGLIVQKGAPPLIGKTNFGIWKSTSDPASLGDNGDEKSAPNKCDAKTGTDDNGGKKETDCDKSRNAKCKTTKAFSIIGVLAGVAGAGAVAAAVFELAELPGAVAIGANAFAAFSYLIIFAITAALFNKENADDGSDADKAGCGLYSPVEKALLNAGYGPSFALFIVAFLLHLGAVGLTVKNGNEAA